ESNQTEQHSPIFNMNGTIWNNPYFVAYENLNGNNRDRVYGNVKATYDIRPDLKFMLRSGRDFYNDKRTMRHAHSSSQYKNGYYQEDDVYFIETNHDMLLSYSPRLNSDFSFDASLGGNLMSQVSKRLGAIAPRLAIPNVYNLTNNGEPLLAGNTYQEKQINSIYGTAQIGFREMVYLDLTGRNDWSSALPKANNSYFYPSASLSVIASDLLGWTNEKFNMLKLRGAASSVRRDLEPYRTLPNFLVTQGWGGETVAIHNNNYPNENIRPEKVVSYEFGFDSRLFNNRLGLDLTYYNSRTTDLIIPVTLNPSAGYDTKLMNVGEMTNHGMEVMLSGTPIRNDNFSWDVFVNYSFNRNRVVSLAEDRGISRIRQLERWASLELRTENTKGDGSSGSLYGDYLIYDDNGQLTHRNGLPQEENGDWGYLGNVNPKWIGSIANDFRYKNWNLSFLFAGQKGGVVHSRTYIEGVRAGSLPESLPFRDENGAGTIIGEGIDIDTGQPNNVGIPVRDYWREYYNNDRIATFDASYLKLRELKVSYRLPQRVLQRTAIKGASLSFIGRNLMLWSDVPHIDPEVSAYGGQFVGVEAVSLPAVRNFGMSVNVAWSRPVVYKKMIIQMKQYLAYIAVAVLAFQSCNDFEKMNIDPNDPAVVPVEMLLPPVISGGVNTMVGSGRRAGQYVQHLAYPGGTSESDGRFNLTGANWREEWNGAVRLIKDVNQMKLLAEQNNQPEYLALAHINKVYILSLVTDAFGDIPYEEAGMGNADGLEFPKFQAQEEVYQRMLEDLEAANTLLAELPAGVSVSRDILYNGDLQKWRKFANTLMIRILMRQSAKKDVSQQVAEIFNNPDRYPVFSSVDDGATLVYNNSRDYYAWFIQNPSSDGSGVDFSDNARISDVMVGLLKSGSDPRLPVYAAPTRNSFLANASDPNKGLEYRGQTAGLSSAEQDALYERTKYDDGDFSVVGRRIRRGDRAFLMTYSELLLLKAEAI